MINPVGRIVLLIAVFGGAAAGAPEPKPLALPRLRARAPIVIAHRGASGLRPEHTLAAYELALRQGADFLEPDVVATKDGVLICRHDNELERTTDVGGRPEFANRKTTKTIDGVPVTGWFSEDFTLAEIQTLRARERIPDVRPDNVAFDSAFGIPTLAQVVRLVQRFEARTRRRAGLYVETKHPTYFAREGRRLDGTRIGFSLGRALVRTLVAERFTDPDRVFIQSFEFANLIELHREIMPKHGVRWPLVQLLGDLTGAFTPPLSAFSVPYDMVYHARERSDLESLYGGLAACMDGGISESTTYRDVVSSKSLRYMAKTYASAIGVWRFALVPRVRLDRPVDGNGDGAAEIRVRATGGTAPWFSIACDAGLLVHVYTLRTEERFLSLDENGTAQAMPKEALQLLDLGVDGLFMDQPAVGVRVRQRWLHRRARHAFWSWAVATIGP